MSETTFTGQPLSKTGEPSVPANDWLQLPAAIELTREPLCRLSLPAN